MHPGEASAGVSQSVAEQHLVPVRKSHCARSTWTWHQRPRYAGQSRTGAVVGFLRYQLSVCKCHPDGVAPTRVTQP